MPIAKFAPRVLSKVRKLELVGRAFKSGPAPTKEANATLGIRSRGNLLDKRTYSVSTVCDEIDQKRESSFSYSAPDTQPEDPLDPQRQTSDVPAHSFRDFQEPQLRISRSLIAKTGALLKSNLIAADQAPS